MRNKTMKVWSLLGTSALLLTSTACGSSGSSNTAPTNPCDAGLCMNFTPGFTATTSIPNSIGVTFSGRHWGFPACRSAPPMRETRTSLMAGV